MNGFVIAIAQWKKCSKILARDQNSKEERDYIVNNRDAFMERSGALVLAIAVYLVFRS